MYSFNISVFYYYDSSSLYCSWCAPPPLYISYHSVESFNISVGFFFNSMIPPAEGVASISCQFRFEEFPEHFWFFYYCNGSVRGRFLMYSISFPCYFSFYSNHSTCASIVRFLFFSSYFAFLFRATIQTASFIDRDVAFIDFNAFLSA